MLETWVRRVLWSSSSAFLIACGSNATDDKGTTNPQETTGVPPCGLDTGYEGDDRCILPPDAAEGFQVHVGPSDYDDPDAVEPFLMQPNTESVECFYLKTPNDHDVYNRKRQYRMRPGTHHLLLKHGQEQADGWGACPGGLAGSFGGSQKSVSDVGFTDVAPEDAGYASLIAAQTQTAAELHYYNSGEEPILREVWVNFYEEDPSTVTAALNGMALIGRQGLEVPPYTTDQLRWGCDNDVPDRRVVQVVGHVHSHTTRFSAWRVNGAQRELIYEMYDWAEPQGIRFNSITQNPQPDAATGTEGGYSGLLYLGAGERLEWECEVANDLDITLTFANEALTAEMCILFGSTPQSPWLCLPERI